MTAPLDLSAVVRARVELDQRRIDAVERMGVAGPSAPLVDRLAGGRLRAMVAGQRAAMTRRDPARLTFESLAELRASTDRMSREGLALAMGALAREAGLDQGLCAQADRFVRWLAAQADVNLARLTVPGDEEAVHGATDVIRRRLPDHGVWDLPVMAHELGHLVASGLSAWDPSTDTVLVPVANELEHLTDGPRSQATELFCDLFATFALGPSFLCTQVFHRLDPGGTARVPEGASHPSDPVRVHAVDRFLEKMKGGSSSHGFDTQLWWARRAWAQMQATAGEECVLTDDEQADVNGQVAGWWAVLDGDLAAFRYSWAPVIEQLTRHIRSAEPLPAGAPFSPADVLNAAWIVRLDGWFRSLPPAPGHEERTTTLLDLSFPPEARS